MIIQRRSEASHIVVRLLSRWCPGDPHLDDHLDRSPATICRVRPAHLPIGGVPKPPSVLRLANPFFLDVLGGRFTVLVNICFSDAISLTDRRSLASSGHDEASCHLCPRVC